MIPYTGWVRSLADTTGVAMFEITGRGKISDRQGEECRGRNWSGTLLVGGIR